jgi:excinuclease ABC subunit C
LPDQPGVYLFKDAHGKPLYVGKALSLRKRVSSYFRPRTPRGSEQALARHPGRTPTLAPRIVQMMRHVAEIEVRSTASEAEALLLEAQLIKERQPHYNVAFRDDKTYPMLKVTNEPFPRLVVTRRRQADGAIYFGPYTEAGLMHEALRFLRRVFPMRTCKTFPKTPCLEYHLGQCLAPCANYITAQSYQRIVDDLTAFLQGQRDQLLRDLSRRMEETSRDERFEEAARLRDQIQALTSVIVAKEKSLAAGPLEQLQTALRLPRLPQRIEAFDISNIFGECAVGSMVVFSGGKPHKRHYRCFKIETVQGIDDYRMMREVIHRRYSGTLTTELPLPDLILIDGGKGQLAAACEELAACSLTVPAVGLAKRFEHIFLPGSQEPIVLLPTSPVLHLAQHIRDEAHRFAIAYHRRMRRRAITASALDPIPGVGPKRKKALLQRFGSLESLAQATVEEVAQGGRMSRSLATTILQQLTRHPTRGMP